MQVYLVFHLVDKVRVFATYTLADTFVAENQHSWSIEEPGYGWEIKAQIVETTVTRMRSRYIAGPATVRATRDFLVGPEHRHRLSISKGDVRDVVLSATGGFTTVSRAGTFFGECTLGDGWELTTG